ncbi:hypothetical protein [Planomicrobium okeanokoites]|uniref:hypothetical protein n=1 Tax=Planomicrobium okeanokoites TaxID=244 RepID=UPI000A013E74|nr:hypothetical protein [Planomicrobium okeanokoites]
MINAKEEREIVAEALKNRYKKDDKLKELIQNANLFYGRKVMSFATEPADKEFIEKHMLEVVSDQFALGYYIMNEILGDPEFQLDEAAWKLGKGYVRNSVFGLLEAVMQDSDVQWQQSETERNFTKRVVATFYNAYDVMVQLRKDILALGAYYAYIESEKYQEPTEMEHDLVLSTPYDLTFLNPQVFMQGDAVFENLEKWTLFQAEYVKGAQWVGDVQLTKKKRVDGEFENRLEILLSHLLDQNERTDIINQMISKIPAEEHSRTHIQFNLVTDHKSYQL